MTKRIGRILGTLAVAAAALFGVSVAASDGGTLTTMNSTSRTVEDGQEFVNTTGQNDAIAFDTTGRITLVATGTTTKTATYAGLAYWNFKMWWNDAPAGSAYQVTKVTSWNVSGGYMTGQVWWPNGHTVGMDNHNGQTWQSLYLGTGTSTTKMEGHTNPADGCIYLTPGGGTWNINADCSA